MTVTTPARMDQDLARRRAGRPARERAGAPAAIGRPRTLADLADLVENGGWWRLEPAIRARFAAMRAATVAAPQIFAGTMTIRRSAAGWLIAEACRLVGSPLVPHQGNAVPVEVAVYPGVLAGIGAGVWWQRRFSFPGRRPLTVRSLKVIDPHAGLLECVEGGLGMELRVFDEGRALHFVSTRYFLRLGRVRIALPHLVTPGAAHVVHRELGGGAFTFSIRFRHKLFGELFFQDGVFKRKGGGS